MRNICFPSFSFLNSFNFQLNEFKYQEQLREQDVRFIEDLNNNHYMGVNESIPTENSSKAFEDLYTTSYQALCLTYDLEDKPDTILFEELMAIYLPFKKYRWAEKIPIMMQKYFYQVLPSLRKCELEGFYRALNLTIFSDNKQTTKDYQGSFYRRVNSSDIKSSKQIRKLLEQSILFEDDVINKHTHKEKMEVSNIFRQSIICPKNQVKENNVVVLSNAVFVENLSKRDQEQIAFSVELYKRFAMVLESLINSAAFVSIPLRHFELQMTQNKARKKIKSFGSESPRNNRFDFAAFPQLTSKSNLPLILKQTPQGIEKRKVVMYNQKLLLQMIESFIQTYTDFIWGFYNISKLEDLQSAKLIDGENIYNLLTDTVWLRVSWVGERGYQYEQIKTQLYLIQKGVPENSVSLPESVISIASALPNAPLKHLKQITKIYRTMAGLEKEMTADGLMLYYRRLFYQLSVRNKFITLYRMVNIVNKLWKGQKFGEVGYAWTTWEASIQIAIKEAQNLSLETLFLQTRQPGLKSSIRPMEIQ